MKITDKMRLDYFKTVPYVSGIVFRSQWSDGTVTWRLNFQANVYPTIRQAIDAAIKQETKSRALKGEKLKGGA